MNEVLKQRLVGALILLALGVIFWPIIFVQPTQEDAAAQQSIPPRPPLSTQPVEAPDQVGLRPSPEIEARREPADDVSVPEPEPAPVPPAPVDATAGSEQQPEPAARTEPLSLDADGVPVAWILQVASVSSADKAEDIRRQLLAMDHDAYVRSVSSNGRRLYRVYVGPKFEQAPLEAIRGEVDAAFGVTSMVRRYVP